MTEINKTNTMHGGDLDLIERYFNIPKKNLINFSGNVNPLGVSESIRKSIAENIENITSYPDVNYLNLRKSIGNYVNTNPYNIIPGNGATELISILIKVLNTKNAVILSPAYSEYKREVVLNNGSFTLFKLEEKENFIINSENLKNTLSEFVDLFIMCNPNNPTGSALNISQIEEILEHCQKKNIFVMVDETYVEFTDESKNISCIPLIEKYKNLFVIRGTAKFFASPGLRLGYGICSNKEITDKINKIKDPWSVNVFAAAAGEVMFSDNEFIAKTKKLINSERTKILAELKKFKNIKCYGTQSNFFLVKLLNTNITSKQVFEHLIKNNIVIRDASDFPFLGDNYLRFCILSPEKNKFLLDELKKIIE